MANTIKQKRGTSDPGASDLVVGELAINTTDGGVFTKTDGGSVVEVGSGGGGGGGASAINDLSDAVTYDSGTGIGLGTGALTNDDGSDNENTALGYNAGNATTSGAGNVLIGHEAGSVRTTIGGATCVGFEAGQNPTSYHTTAVGYQALKGASGTNTSSNNTALGYKAGTAVTSTGKRNTFLGYSSGKSATSGDKNVIIGAIAGDDITTGSANVIIGQACANGDTEYARRLTTGSNNIILGNLAEASASTVDNEITLGNASITSLRIPGLQSSASNGQVLTYNSTNGNIALADAGGGGGEWNLISTTTVSSAVASVDFTSIGSYNRYVLLWDAEMDGAQSSKIQIYDNGSLVTSSDYVMLRSRMSSGGSAFATTFNGWIFTNGMVSQIGRFEISVAAPRATVEMMQGGLLGTADTCNTMFVHGGMKSTYSITDITGFSFTTTAGTAEIESGRFSLYGIGQ